MTRDEAMQDSRKLKWQPIETVPKDRVIIVGFWGVMSGCFHIARVKWVDPYQYQIDAGHRLATWAEQPTENNRFWENLPKVWCEDEIGEPSREDHDPHYKADDGDPHNVPDYSKAKE